MRRVLTHALAALAFAACAPLFAARAQSGVKPKSEGDGAGAAAAAVPTVKSGDAKTLYEDASGYARRRFDEFAKTAGVSDAPLTLMTAMSSGGNVAMINASVLGTSSAPAIPCSARAAISTSTLGATAQIVLTSSRDGADFGTAIEESPARGFIAKGELSGPTLAAVTG